MAVVDLDSGYPIPAVQISASAKRFGSTGYRTLRVVTVSDVRYVIPLGTLRKTGKWRITLNASGVNVVPAQMAVDVVRS